MIKKILLFLKFYSLVLIKTIVVLFRKDRTLKKINLDYISSPHSEDDFLLLNFTFKNALYYKINNTKYLYDGSKLIYLKPQNHKVNFEAIGLSMRFKKTIEIKPNLKTEFLSFKANTQNLKLAYNTKSDIIVINLNHSINLKHIELSFNEIKFKNQSTTIKLNTFNQFDYL